MYARFSMKFIKNDDVLMEIKRCIPNGKYRLNITIPSDNDVKLLNFKQIDQCAVKYPNNLL